MKIRTRLLLFLLPTLIGGIALVSSMLAYNWYIDQQFQERLLLILLCSGLTIAIIIATLFVIADKISRPIQKLNYTALAIAAGQYGESIHIQGPKEIVELANTLNTMSECLLENINRLKENSLVRERMYGEYECSMLLQHLMLQKNIDNCRSDAVAVKSITFFSDTPRGFLLDFPKTEHPHLFPIHIAEAEEEGFEGMYELLTQYKSSKEAKISSILLLDRQTATLQWKGPHIPLLWSLEKKQFVDSPATVESGDLFFLHNRGFTRLFPSNEFLTKVLRIFAIEGFETLTTMLQKEIAFATKRKDIEEDLHLLCFQILYSS